MGEREGARGRERLIVFTDLDGTLLEGESYRFDAARPALDFLRHRRIPVILCSSKTRLEVEHYRRLLRNEHAFVIENGGDGTGQCLSCYSGMKTGEPRNLWTNWRIMGVLRTYDSAMRPELLEWIKAVGEVDVLVGIPCFNNEETVGHVVQVAARGLAEHFPGRQAALLVSDGGSLDDSREHAEAAPIPPGIERHVAIYRGMPGKGTSLRAVFEAATKLKVSACVVLDSDLRSITPEWVKLLADPVLTRQADYVTPAYLRHKYDGTITNHIVYPLTRALYGKQLRQPIGGDFGLSGEMTAFFVREQDREQVDVWATDVARFGIDVWMTTCALGEDFKVAQTRLGVKTHDVKDPGADLGPMFTQVVGTLYYLMGQYEHRWMRVQGSTPVEIIGEASTTPKLEPLAVSLSTIKKEFYEGFHHFAPLYRQVLDLAKGLP